MKNIFTLKGKHSDTETKPVIDEVLKNEAAFAFARFMKFEKKYS